MFIAPPQFSRAMHGFDDSSVCSTAADIAIHVADDLLICRTGSALQQSCGSKDHPRYAIPTLKCFGIQKGLLHWMQILSPGESFNCGYLLACCRRDLHAAGTDGGAFNQNCARTALPLT